MRGDLDHIALYLQGNELATATSPITKTLSALLKEQTPENWTAHGFFTPKLDSLADFLRCFLLKFCNLKEVVTTMKCDVPPVIPLLKLFDPIHFLCSTLWQYSRENNLGLSELQIHLIPLKVHPPKAATGGGIYVNGFQLNGGKISDRTFLDEEYSREYENKMPSCLLLVTRRKNSVSYHVTPSLLSLY